MEYKKWNSVEKKPTLWRYFVYRGRYYYNHSMLFDERLFLLLVDNEHCSSSFDYWHLLYLHIIKKILMLQSVPFEILCIYEHSARLKNLAGCFLMLWYICNQPRNRGWRFLRNNGCGSPAAGLSLLMDSGYTVSYRFGYAAVTAQKPHDCCVFRFL